MGSCCGPSSSKYNHKSKKQELKGKLFKITHTDMNGKQVIRSHLTFDDTHKIQNKNFAELRPQFNQNKECQFWEFVQESEQSDYFWIKNGQKSNETKQDVYLTLLKKDQKQNSDYIVELLPLDKKSHNQLWKFSLGHYRRFKISPKLEQELFLQSPEKSAKNEYKTVCICRPKNKQLRWDQYWKISPKKQYLKMSIQDYAQEQIFLTGFKGKYITQNSSKIEQYFNSIQQYASSSYPSLGRMQPFMVAYPKNQDDIRILLNYAQKQKKKVVTRSGGHQYCGLSSGAKDTVLISMNNFNKFQKGKDGLLEVQPCIALIDLSRKLVDLKISIPHGQCFLVNIGGHAQTGGWGNFLRGFGLCTDYVQAFDIILAKQKTTRRVTRPKKSVQIVSDQDKLNQLIFRGVLSGNAGSFGVVTKYYFNYIKDNDHPQSKGFNRTKIFSKQLFTAMMKIFQQWSKLVELNKDQDLDGIDLIVTVSKFSTPLIPQFLKEQIKIISIFGYYQDPKGGKQMNTKLRDLYTMIQSYGNIVDEIQQFLVNEGSMKLQNKTPLSQLANNSIFRPPAMTASGRQYDLPYRKRCNVTMTALKDQFITQFVDKFVEIVYKHPQIDFVSQMNLGGGACKIKGKQQINGLTVTCIPLRDYVFAFTFDLFYKDENGRKSALIIQKEMEEILYKTYNTKPETQKRFFWASFGEEQQLDMTKDKTIEMYYDNKQQYQQLQKLKQMIDPEDLFHTEMTVKLPKSNNRA